MYSAKKRNETNYGQRSKIIFHFSEPSKLLSLSLFEEEFSTLFFVLFCFFLLFSPPTSPLVNKKEMEFSLFITEPPAEQDPLSVENPSSPFSVFDEFSSSFPSSIDPQIISSPDDHIASSPDYYSSPTIGVEESSQCSRFDDFGRGITENGSFYSSTAVAPSTTLPEDCSQHQQQQPVYQLLHQNPSSFQQPPFFPPQTLPPQTENGKELFSFEKSSEVFPKKENSQQHSLFSAPPPSTKEEKQSYSSESRKRKRRAKVAAARASRRLPEKEGVEPLLLAETSETKEQKRRRKNRESAARCRAEVKEKLDKFEKLELRVKELEEENQVLRAALLRGQQPIPVQFPPAETVSYPDPFWQQGGTPQFKSAAAFSLCVVLFAFGMIFSSFGFFSFFLFLSLCFFFFSIPLSLFLSIIQQLSHQSLFFFIFFFNFFF